jgi:hypothetical protein
MGCSEIALQPTSRRKRSGRHSPRRAITRYYNVASCLFGANERCRQLSQASTARRTVSLYLAVTSLRVAFATTSPPAQLIFQNHC